MQNTSKINKSIKLYPIFYALSADLIFFVPIDTLFFTLAKGLDASQISAIMMIGVLVCILSQKLIVKIVNNIGNAKSIRLGAFLLFLSSVILTFGKSFFLMCIYRIVYELAFMFWNMSSILLRNDLIYLNKKEEFYTIRNKAKVMYGIATMVTALLSGYLFNINMYFPMYISIIMYFILFIISFGFSETKVNEKEEDKVNISSEKIKITSTLGLVILSNALFYAIIKMGQANSKLFMQNDFQKLFSIETVTYCITVIVLLSRIARIIGNVIFGKLYLKIKDKMGILLTILECTSFSLLIIGHYIQFSLIAKIVVMALGFFTILAIRDSFQIYIEDTALSITKSSQQQKIMVDIETYRKLGQLILSGAFTLILMKYELIAIEFVLVALSLFEIIVNRKMYRKLIKIKD